MYYILTSTVSWDDVLAMKNYAYTMILGRTRVM